MRLPPPSSHPPYLRRRQGTRFERQFHTQTPALLTCLLVALFTFQHPIPAAAKKAVSISLEMRQPRALRPDSTKGFHPIVRIHEPQPAPRNALHALVRNVLSVRGRKSYHDVSLYGGMVAVGEYYAKVQIGGQTLRVQIDTGSATLAVPLKECKNCKRGDMRYSVKESNSTIAEYLSCEHGDCGTNTCGYDCGSCSSTKACCSKGNEEHCAFHLNFGDGSGAQGVLVRDELQWGDVKFPVTFGGINSDSPDFERSQVDGILGMAYPSLACNPSCVTPAFEAMLKTVKEMKDIFSICITYDSGRIVLGDYDPLMSTQPITWVPMQLSSRPSFYSFPLEGNLMVDDKELALPDYSRAIVDSGTTLIVFTHSTFNKFKKYLLTNYCDVPGLCDEETWFKPAHCTKIKDEDRNKLPTLKMRLDGFDVIMGPSDYLINYASKGPQFWCVGIMALDAMSGGVDVILGNTVMKKYVTIYDRENKKLGFAESDTSCGLDVNKGASALPVPGNSEGNNDSNNDETEVDGDKDDPNASGGGGEGDGQKQVPKESDATLCATGQNCSSCVAIEGAKCTWESECVPGNSWPLMCSIETIEAKLVYVIGGAVVAVIAAIVVVAVIVHSYRKRRDAEAEGAVVDEGDVQEPLAPNRSDPVNARSAFAIDDDDA